MMIETVVVIVISILLALAVSLLVQAAPYSRDEDDRFK